MRELCAGRPSNRPSRSAGGWTSSRPTTRRGGRWRRGSSSTACARPRSPSRRRTSTTRACRGRMHMTRARSSASPRGPTASSSKVRSATWSVNPRAHALRAFHSTHTTRPSATSATAGPPHPPAACIRRTRLPHRTNPALSDGAVLRVGVRKPRRLPLTPCSCLRSTQTILVPT